MTIDEAIKQVNEHNYIHRSKEPRAVYITEAFNTLIGIVKKYQKIEQIIKDYDFDVMPEDYWYLDRIREVIEDGSN